MVIFCPKKVVVTVLVVFSFFLVLTTRHSFFFINLKDIAAFLGLIMLFSLVDVSWECLIFEISFFSVKSCLLCVYQ